MGFRISPERTPPLRVLELCGTDQALRGFLGPQPGFPSKTLVCNFEIALHIPACSLRDYFEQLVLGLKLVSELFVASVTSKLAT